MWILRLDQLRTTDIDCIYWIKYKWLFGYGSRSYRFLFIISHGGNL